MRTMKDFEKDFAELIELGDIYIEYEQLEYTIFILADGTPINSLFELGQRSIDHNCVLCNDGYSMEEMVTIEPESQTIILPKTITKEQFEIMKGYDNMSWEVKIESPYNDDVGYLINKLLECGCSLTTALLVILDGTWAVIPEDEIDDYTDDEKDGFFYLDNDTVVDVW